MTTPEPDIGAWVNRCSKRLAALDPNSPLDGTDWDEIAGDLWAAEPRRVPETAADDWHRAHALLRSVEHARE